MKKGWVGGRGWGGRMALEWIGEGWKVVGEGRVRERGVKGWLVRVAEMRERNREKDVFGINKSLLVLHHNPVCQF